MPKQRSNGFPSVLYVVREEEDGKPNTHYFIAESDTENFEHGKIVAMYNLDSVRKLFVSSRLAPVDASGEEIQ